MEERGKGGQELDPWLQKMQRPNPQSKEQNIFTYSKPCVTHVTIIIVFL